MDPSSELLERWQQTRDREALDELLRIEVRLLQQKLRQKGGGMMRGSVSAADLAQEAVFKFLRKEDLPQFEHPNIMRSYLWRTAWNLLIDRLRKADRKITRLKQSQSWALGDVLRTTGGLASVENDDRDYAMQLVVNLLPPQDQDILDLVYFQELDLEAAGARIGISTEAATMRASRARRKLMEKLLDWNELIG